MTNLEPPFGTCGATSLRYYDQYTVARCSSECETDFVEEVCGCRELEMPHEDGKNCQDYVFEKCITILCAQSQFHINLRLVKIIKNI